MKWSNTTDTMGKKSTDNIEENYIEDNRNVFRKLYLTRPALRKFYGSAKIHKLLSDDVNNLQFRSIVSNI